MLHPPGKVSVLERQALRVFEESEQAVVAHIEKIVAQVIVRRLAAVALERHAAHVYQLQLQHACVEIHGAGQVVGEPR